MQDILKHVGFVGLGLMGSRMALTLQRKGFAVTAWNRTRSKAEALRAHGLDVAESLKALASKVDVLCTCVADPAALQEVTEGLLEGARAGQLWVDFSTVAPEDTRRLSALLAKRGMDFVEAPVTGSRTGAEQGSLVLMVGASETAFARAQPLFAAVGSKTIHCGPVGAGSQVKLAGNALIALMLEGLSEGLLLTQKAGVSPQKFLEVVQASGFRSPYFDFKGKAVLERDFDTHFSIDLMFKDLSLFLASAHKHQVPTPAVESVHATYQKAREAGLGAQDIAGVVQVLE